MNLRVGDYIYINCCYEEYEYSRFIAKIVGFSDDSEEVRLKYLSGTRIEYSMNCTEDEEWFSIIFLKRLNFKKIKYKSEIK